MPNTLANFMHNVMGVSMEKMQQTCVTCKWLNMESSCWTKHTPPRLKPDAGGRCDWPVPAFVLPDSITKAYGFHGIGNSRSWMDARHVGCPAWEGK